MSKYVSLLTVLLAVSSGLAWATETTVKLYVFNCGKVRIPSVVAFGLTDDETFVRELVVPCYMIEHGDQRMLWDGGLPSALAKSTGWQDSPTGSGSQLRLDSSLSQQLESMGLSMASLDYVSFSHFHFDHIGVGNEVPNATLIVQQAEFDAAFTEPVAISTFDPRLYSELKNNKRIVINGDYDVFGDGNVNLISAPGHTPGHQVLQLNLKNFGPLILSGDLYHFRLSRQHRRIPHFNHNVEQTLESMTKVEEIVKRSGATFWIQHDLAKFNSLKTAPNYYD